MMQVMYMRPDFPIWTHDMKKFPRKNLGNCVRVSIVP